MIKSKLPNNVLGKIWKLADVDKDGMLDSDEFALAMHLINVKLDGELNHLLLVVNLSDFVFQVMIYLRNFPHILCLPLREDFELIFLLWLCVLIFWTVPTLGFFVKFACN